jgi:hypothetical protein
VAVARKLSVLLHRLWVSAEVYEPLRNTYRRQEQEEGGSVEEGRWNIAKHTQEVKILVHSGEATLKWRMATAELARTRFGSSMRRLRYCELGLPFQEGRSEDCSAFGSKRRISSYAPSYQKESSPRVTHPDALVKVLEKVARCMSAHLATSPTTRPPSCGPRRSRPGGGLCPRPASSCRRYRSARDGRCS